MSRGGAEARGREDRAQRREQPGTHLYAVPLAAAFGFSPVR